MARAVLVLLIALFAPSLTFSVEKNSADKVAEAQVVNNESANLRRELATIKEFDDRLISTVHWSLGTIVAVLLGMTGVGWFANYRNYERDRAAMQAELRAYVLEQWKELSVKLENTSTASSAKHQAAIETGLHESSLRTTKALADQKTRLEALISAAKQDFGTRLEELRFEFKEFLSDTAKDGPDFSAYLAHKEFLIVALNRGWETKIVKALERIISYLQKREEFWFDDLAFLRRTSEKLPNLLRHFGIAY